MHRGERDGECAIFRRHPPDNVLARDANLPWGNETGLCALGGITPHCAKRARAGRSGLRFARSTIALARANRNCPDTLARIDCDRGRRGRGTGGRADEGLPFSWQIFRSCGQAGA